jgi:hypothetical protein
MIMATIVTGGALLDEVETGAVQNAIGHRLSVLSDVKRAGKLIKEEEKEAKELLEIWHDLNGSDADPSEFLGKSFPEFETPEDYN